LVVAAIGAAAVWFGTSNGVGVSIDSMSYVRGAENIARTNRYAVISDEGGLQNVDHWPPLYSISIAIPIFAGVSTMESVRSVNALSFFALLYLSALLVRRLSSGAAVVPVLAIICILAAPDIVRNHVMAWSETLFIPLLLLGLLKMLDYFSSNRMRDLLFASVCFGLAVIGRYSGAAFIVGGAASLILRDLKQPGRLRFVRPLAFCAVSGLPTALWFARNYFATSRAHDRSFDPRFLSVDHVRAAAEAVSRWLLPVWVPLRVRVVWVAVALLIFVVALRGNHGRAAHEVALDVSRNGEFWVLVGLCVVAYLGFVFVTILFFDYDVQFDVRMMTPVFALLVIFLATVGKSLFARPVSRSGKLLAIAIVASVVLLASDTALHLYARHKDPAQYGSVRWTQARAWSVVRSAAAGTKIYSSSPYVSKYFVERPVSQFPERPEPGDEAAVASYREKLQAIADGVNGGDAYVLFAFYPRLDETDVVLDRDARSILRATTVDSTDNVVLYRIAR